MLFLRAAVFDMVVALRLIQGVLLVSFLLLSDEALVRGQGFCIIRWFFFGAELGLFTAGWLKLIFNPLFIVVGLLNEVVKQSTGVELFAIIHQDIQLLVKVVPLLPLVPMIGIHSSLFVPADLAHY